MALPFPEFAVWLRSKLKDLNTDEGVFGEYIIGILDSDDTTDEKNDALQGLLSEIVDESINDLCTEIIGMWVSYKEKEPPPGERPLKPTEVDIKLKQVSEHHCVPTKPKQYTEEEKKIREAILAQYSQTSDDEDGDNHVVQTTSGAGSTNKLEMNTNAAVVAAAEREKRENAKIESQKKKEKDKEDREKQKQLKEDKKEKRKTQKGERRR